MECGRERHRHGRIPREDGWLRRCGDAGAVSAQIIAADGYLEFRATETSSLRIVGLGKRAMGTPATPVKFAFALQPGGIAEVRENGVYRAETPFASGDLFRITIAGLAVTYTKNGARIHESALSAPQPLRVRATLYSAASTVTDAVVSSPR